PPHASGKRGTPGTQAGTGCGPRRTSSTGTTPASAPATAPDPAPAERVGRPRRGNRPENPGPRFHPRTKIGPAGCRTGPNGPDARAAVDLRRAPAQPISGVGSFLFPGPDTR